MAEPTLTFTYNPAEITTPSISRARFELGDIAVDYAH